MAGSFTRAAQNLGNSKSVVSRCISRLEKELGVQLRYRSTHSLSVTDAGERLFTLCKDLALRIGGTVCGIFSRPVCLTGPHGVRGISA